MMDAFEDCISMALDTNTCDGNKAPTRPTTIKSNTTLTNNSLMNFMNYSHLNVLKAMA